MNRTVQRSRWRDERGSAGGLALIALLAMGALVIVLGLVVDGGAKAAASDRANRIAMEAARAGAQVLTQQQGGVDAVVQQYLAAEGVSGDVVVSVDRVDVTVELSEPTTVLSIIGYTRIQVTGYGFALADYAQAGG